MSNDDATLLARVSQGDVDALRALLERVGPQIWQEIQNDIGTAWKSTIDADDVMQVTYLEAFLQMERMNAKDERGFIGWLRRIAQNNLRDAIRELERLKRPNPKNRVHAPAGQDSYVTLIEVLGGASSATPSRVVAKQEAADAINRILEQLPPDYARVIRLYDLEGKEIANVASDIGRSAGAVHMLRARAHDRLRELLGTETKFFSHPS